MATRPGSQLEPIAGYRLVERLGAGGFGEVWKAEAPGGIPKAIKFIHGSLDEEGNDKQASQELRSLHRVKDVHHPFLLQLERVDIIDGQLIMVMELADRDLMMRFKECQRSGFPGIPREELLRYMEETAEVLDLMNQVHGLQHLDIKPQNLFLVRNHIKVADFGMVKDLQGITATVTGGITPLYAAPETFDNRVSRTSDQYSLAIVYQEVLTGVRPFKGTNAMQLLMQHCSQPPDLTPLPPGDRAAIGRALAKNHTDRFPSCAEFIKALRTAPAGDLGITCRVQAIPLDSPTPASVPSMHKDTTSEMYGGVVRKPAEPPPQSNRNSPGQPNFPTNDRAEDPAALLPPPFDPDKSPRLHRSDRKKSGPRSKSDDTIRSKSATLRIKKAVQETIQKGAVDPADEIICPRCDYPLFDPDNLGWCAQCGYCDAIEGNHSAQASRIGEFIDGLPGWAWGLLIGSLLLLGLTGCLLKLL